MKNNMRYLKKFNEELESNDPTLERFISIISKHFDESDVEYLGQVNMYEYINNGVSETYNEMKKRLGEYSDYIYEGIMGQRLEELINELERKIFSVNGNLFRVSDNLLETEHNLGRFKEQLQYEDEDEEFINGLDWKYGLELLDSKEEYKLYSTWDDNY